MDYNACVACANKKYTNMSESLRQLCNHPCVNCVHCVNLHHLSPNIDFLLPKNDSVQTHWMQGQKRIVGARLNIFLKTIVNLLQNVCTDM